MISCLIFPGLYSPFDHLRQYEFAAFNGEVKAIHDFIPIGHLINLQLVKVHHLIFNVDGNGINRDILL